MVQFRVLFSLCVLSLYCNECNLNKLDRIITGFKNYVSKILHLGRHSNERQDTVQNQDDTDSKQVNENQQTNMNERNRVIDNDDDILFGRLSKTNYGEFAWLRRKAQLMLWHFGFILLDEGDYDTFRADCRRLASVNTEATHGELDGPDNSAIDVIVITLMDGLKRVIQKVENVQYHQKTALRGLVWSNVSIMQLIQKKEITIRYSGPYKWICEQTTPFESPHAVLKSSVIRFLTKVEWYAKSSIGVDPRDDVNTLRLSFVTALEKMKPTKYSYEQFIGHQLDEYDFDSLFILKQFTCNEMKRLLLQYPVLGTRNSRFQDKTSSCTMRRLYAPFLEIIVDNIDVVFFMMDTDVMKKILNHVYNNVHLDTVQYKQDVKSFLNRLCLLLNNDKTSNINGDIYYRKLENLNVPTPPQPADDVDITKEWMLFLFTMKIKEFGSKYVEARLSEMDRGFHNVYQHKRRLRCLLTFFPIQRCVYPETVNELRLIKFHPYTKFGNPLFK